MVKISFDIDKTMKDQLDQLAKEQDRSVSSLIRKSVKQFLAQPSSVTLINPPDLIKQEPPKKPAPAKDESMAALINHPKNQGRIPKIKKACAIYYREHGEWPQDTVRKQAKVEETMEQKADRLLAQFGTD
jgi:hypothetical protein